MASLPRLYYCGFQRNGGPTWTSGNGGNVEGRRGWFLNHQPVGVLSALFRPSFTGGNGAVDGLPHLLLGDTDWTESEEDLRLVGDVLHQAVGFKHSLDLKMPKYTNQTIFVPTLRHLLIPGLTVSVRRHSPTQRAQLRGRRFCRGFRAELKISNQWVSTGKHGGFWQVSESAACGFNDHSYFRLPQVLSQTESYLQQLLTQVLAVLPQWKVRVQKCKAVQMVLNLCSSSVTEKCLIAEAWCPTAKLPELQSALREGGVGQPKAAQTCRCRTQVFRTTSTPPPPFFFCFYLAHQRKSGSTVDSFYNRLVTSTPPPTLFPLNSFTTGFQNIVDAYGVANYREVNPGGPVHFWKDCICAPWSLTWLLPVGTPPQRCTPL